MTASLAVRTGSTLCSAGDNSKRSEKNELVSAMTAVCKQGCRWSNEMTLLLSISSHSCCYQQAKAGAAWEDGVECVCVGGGADTGRQIKQTGEEEGMMRGGTE